MNKKGISPLVSTLLLIFFAVALGLVVMSWGKTAQIEEIEASCDEIDLDIITINDESQICTAEGKLKFTLENTGSVKINGVKLFIISNEIEKIDLEADIPAADIVNLETAYSSTQIQKIKITPKVSDHLQEEFCAKKGVELENINECR
jgi:flagellin-like protein